MRNEKQVKDAVKKLLDDVGAWYYMPVQTGFGAHGIPDFVCCVAGKFLGVETKFGGNVQSAWQLKQELAIDRASGVYLVITEKDLPLLEATLQELAQGCRGGISQCKYVTPAERQRIQNDANRALRQLLDEAPVCS